MYWHLRGVGMWLCFAKQTGLQLTTTAYNKIIMIRGIVKSIFGNLLNIYLFLFEVNV
jgi:hypothetical protein